ncbi:MAG: rane protein [Sphingomonas bacterium]|uniref:hypothetical protein n=1 Tax=Sphingomonas bacterium TaxID=1895847 RepID=UPI00260506C9|nr:hypothetical protein [Sphingomonas bacterium]MDB5705762.1 rane protein [Sphingomonas bacterium]
MFGAIAFAYGLLTSFVLSGAARNRKLQRPNPRILDHVGHVCFGCSAALSVLLFVHAGQLYFAG